MSQSWYVLHSKPNREEFLYSQLCHRDIEVFYPRFRVEPVNPRARKSRPLFPGYLFVCVDLDEISLSSLLWVPGANQVVSFDHEPAKVPDDVIKTVEKQVARINARPKGEKPRMKHGDPVMIHGGPFEGYQGIFDTEIEGSERVRLLIKLLHARQVRIQIPAAMAKPQTV